MVKITWPSGYSVRTSLDPRMPKAWYHRLVDMLTSRFGATYASPIGISMSAFFNPGARFRRMNPAEGEGPHRRRHVHPPRPRREGDRSRGGLRPAGEAEPAAARPGH